MPSSPARKWVVLYTHLLNVLILLLVSHRASAETDNQTLLSIYDTLVYRNQNLTQEQWDANQRLRESLTSEMVPIAISKQKETPDGDVNLEFAALAGFTAIFEDELSPQLKAEAISVLLETMSVCIKLSKGGVHHLVGKLDVGSAFLRNLKDPRIVAACQAYKEASRKLQLIAPRYYDNQTNPIDPGSEFPPLSEAVEEILAPLQKLEIPQLSPKATGQTAPPSPKPTAAQLPDRLAAEDRGIWPRLAVIGGTLLVALVGWFHWRKCRQN